MPIKRWASGFTSTVYKALYGNHLLKQIYYGRQLVFDAGSDFNYFDITPGTKTITIPTRAVYNIQLVGGGGGGRADAFPYGGYWWSSAGSGGSGAYVYGWKELEAGTYTVTVGAGGAGGFNSASYDGTASTGFGETAGGGIKGVAGGGGAGGTATVDVLQGVNGYQGATGNLNVGGVSTGRTKTPYDGSLDGIGSGGASSGNGGNGLVAVSYLSPPLSPIFSYDTPGTYTVTIPITALYEIVVVGAGGGGAAQGDKYTWKSSSAGGGSGAYVKGTIKLTAGSQYQVVVGAGGAGHGGGWTQQGDAGGSSSFSTLISCTGGGGGYAAFTDGTPAETGGAGGTYSVQDGITVLANINGNTGGITTDIISTEAQGGASVYNGYGKGGNARATGHNAGYGNPGGNGFVSIRQLSGTAPTTFTVNVNPSDATVNFSAMPVDGILARNGNTVTAYPGTQITYTITKSGYTTYTETITLLSQTTKNITMVPRRTITVTSTSNPISSAQYKINNGDWQTLTLTNNIGTIICDDGNDLLVSALGGNYNEEDEAKQGTVYSKRIRTITGDDTLTFNFAYEAWDEVKYCACRSAAGTGSNLAFIALDESYLSYSTASNFKYLDIVYDNISIEGETFNNVPSYRFLVKHGTSFTFGLEIPDHRYSVESANAAIQYTPGESYYVGPTWTNFFAVDVVTIALTDNTAVVSDLSTPIYTRQENSIRVMRGQTLQYTVYKDSHTYTDSYVNDEFLSAPTTETITINPTTFLGYTVTFTGSPADALIKVNDVAISGNSIYLYKDEGISTYSINKDGYYGISGDFGSTFLDFTLTYSLISSQVTPLFESSTPGSSTLALSTEGLYNIIIVGAGGGGCGNGAKGSSYSAATGGAGAGLVLNAMLPVETLNITIGTGGNGTGGGDYQGGAAGTGGASSVSLGSTMIGTCNGGTGGRAWFRGGSSVGTGGTYSTGSYITEIITQTRGPNGTGGNANDYLYTCQVPIAGIAAGNGGAALGASYSYKWRGDKGTDGYVYVGLVCPKVIFESSTAGSYTITIPITATYEVILVGGGGGAGRTWYYDRGYNIARAGGGSGACVRGTVEIAAGTYTVVVGEGGTAGGDAHASRHQGGTGGSSTFFGQTAGGGTGGVVWFENTVSGTQATAGAGGTATASSPWTATNGNPGTARNNSWGVEPSIQGGASVYGGYGAGTADASAAGGSGFVSIRLA